MAGRVDEPGGGQQPGVGHAIWRLLVAFAQACRHGARRLGAWNNSRGAGASGLARLVEVHALQTAGDAFVTVALAGSLFFSVSPGTARSRIGLYLLIAMAPFAVVAPVLGPLLDRFRHGRRFAIATTMVARATLALVIGHALAGKHLTPTEALALYPAAFGVLVAQKTYSIVRSAAVPRVLPPELTLVQANSRLTIVSVIGSFAAAAVALILTKAAGHQFALRVGALVYATAAVFALRLPRHADGGADTRAQEGHLRLASPLKLGQPDAIVGGVLRSAAALRWLAGFLLFYGAFVVQEHSIGGMPKAVALSALAIGLGAGNFGGTVIGARIVTFNATRLAVVLLLVTAATTAFTALDFGLLSVFAVAVISAATAAITKLGLDATIQQRVDDSVRTSTFARSETTLQLAWVVGGAVGILLPTRPLVGFSVATAGLAAALVAAVGFARRRGGTTPRAAT
ncbi:MAG TPA: MFS transporter [Mycobacteriales bacterium]|nr:MFS transporter [Mycobacteriales bacterium]